MAVRFSYYVVGVFDMLGQTRKLGQPIPFPASTEDEQQAIVDNVMDTADAVRLFRRQLKKSFDYFNEENANSPLIAQLPSAQREQFRRRTVNWGMSDTFVFAVPFGREQRAAALAARGESPSFQGST